MAKPTQRVIGRGERVLPGVWRLRLPLPWPGVPHCNAWALQAGDGIVLVDTGMHEPGSLAHLERALGQVNLNLENVRLVDVTPLYRTQDEASKKLEAKPAPPWLADIASAVSASDPSQDGSLMTLEDVRKKYPESKAGDPYEAVWKRFFPDEHTGH